MNRELYETLKNVSLIEKVIKNDNTPMIDKAIFLEGKNCFPSHSQRNH